MFTHIVVYSLTDKNDIPEVVRRLREMTALAPLVTTMTVGIDESKTPASYDIGLVTTHPDANHYEQYRTHPVHQELLAWLVPLLADRKVVDFSAE
jgi:hypothetical protein